MYRVCGRCVAVVMAAVFLECISAVRAQDEGCYTSGSVAGIVIATVVVTLVMGGLAAAFVWYLWKQRKVGYGNGKSQEKPIACPPMLPDKDLIGHEKNDYAFDNPYFKDDETDTATPDAAEKGEAGYRTDNGDISSTQNAKASNGTTGPQPKKNRPFSSLPFHAVFHPSGKKQRATMDDTYISKHLERVTVPLRGHDFTGLGFNICGNMRDGIFVKDVLHRGPASESGKIKAGDRIVGVTVSFAAMVYEDALTILSYASPYDVKLEIEKCSAATSPGGVPHLPASSPKRIGASTSFRSNGQRRLFHPLYRSQSIDDLTQIGKDTFLAKSSNLRDSNSSATPKRSQSVEANNCGTKARPGYTNKSSQEDSTPKLLSNGKKSRNSSTSSWESTSEKNQQAPPEEVPCVKKEAKSSRFRVEQINVKSEAPSSQTKVTPPLKPARDAAENKQVVEVNGISESADKIETSHSEAAVEQPKSAVEANGIPPTSEPDSSDGEKPTAPPRKAGTPAKRRAPAPPPTASATSKTETSALVHRTDDTLETAASHPEVIVREHSASEPPPPPTSALPDFSDPVDIQDVRDFGSSDNSSLASGGERGPQKEETSSPGKRKASSLGDLTKLDHGANKKASTPSAILERAVSLDLQQSLPGENLIKQKKILRAPTFEDDYDEGREGDFPDGEGLGLKRWENGLDKVFGDLTNGAVELEKEMDINETVKVISTSEITTTITNTIITAEKLESETVASDEPSPEKSLADAEVKTESSANKGSQENDPDSSPQLTSTPLKKLIEVKPFLQDDDDMLDEIPYLASGKQEVAEELFTKKTVSSAAVEELSEKKEDSSTEEEKSPSSPSQQEESSVKITDSTAEKEEPSIRQEESRAVHSIQMTNSNSSSVPVLSPVTISIPVIKPDLTQFEKLPSPPNASTHPTLDPSWRLAKSSEEGAKLSSLERISVQSLYRPIFSSNKEITDDPPVEEKLVNGNDSDSSDQYSSALENTTVSSIEKTSTLSVTLSPAPVTTKTPNNVAGFAKTLIVPGPNEVESLLNLAAEPNTPPPSLDPPPKPVESE